METHFSLNQYVKKSRLANFKFHNSCWYLNNIKVIKIIYLRFIRFLIFNLISSVKMSVTKFVIRPRNTYYIYIYNISYIILSQFNFVVLFVLEVLIKICNPNKYLLLLLHTHHRSLVFTTNKDSSRIIHKTYLSTRTLTN